MLGHLLTRRYAFATTPREAARRKLNATWSTCACYVLGIILLRSVPRKTRERRGRRDTDNVCARESYFSAIPVCRQATSRRYDTVSTATGYKLHITRVDIQRRPSVDLAKSKERQTLLTRIRAQEFDAILLSPPSSTFSRAPWANFKGPRPVRSAAKPRGLDKLTAAERDRCILGNIFADSTWEVVELAIEVNISFLLLEQPEDLGMLATGPFRGQRPASMWKWPAMSKVAKLPKVTTLALHRSSFGTSYPKPTRLLLLGARQLPDFCYVGPHL